jgi:hypothetical protein
MPRIVLHIFLFFLYATAQAQYGDAYHKANQEKINKEQKAYTDAYIDALRYNRNTSAKSSGSADTKAAQELADLFAARAGRETSTQKAARLQKEQLDYQTYLQKKAIADKASADYFKDDNERRDRILLPLKAMYKEAGFPDFEADYLSRSHLVDKLSVNREKHIYTYEVNERSYRAREAFMEFNKISGTAGFEELFYLISDFNVLGYSALTAMEKLEQRFLGKKPVLDAVGLMNTASFWGDGAESYSSGQFYYSGKVIQEKMLNNFVKWFDKYPEAAMQVASKASPDANPFKVLAKQEIDKKEYASATRFILLALQTPKSWGKDIERSRNAIKTFSSVFYDKKSELDKTACKKINFTAADIREIATNHEVPARMVLEWLCGMQTNKLATSGYDGGIVIFRATNFAALLKGLGEQGDHDAMNAYALRVGFDEQKENPKQAIGMWQQAARGGSTWAMYNMLVASTWQLKWYKPEHLASAKELWKNFVPSTPYDEAELVTKKYRMGELAK